MQPPQLAQNRILAALEADDREAIWAGSTLVAMTLRQPLETLGEPIACVYFPLSGLASVVMHRGDAKVEVGIIGREGVTAIAAILGRKTAPLECFVQAVGEALRIPVRLLAALSDARPALRSLLLLYVQEFYLQVAETALSNARGKLENRLARWILMTNDRIDDETIFLTHEFLSRMLGVRRPGITIALQSLEERRLIRNTRGRITVLDRVRLMEAAGSFYEGPPGRLDLV